MAEYVDPINSKSFYDYNVALNEASRKSAQAEIDAAKARGVDLLNPEGGVLNDTTGNAIRLRAMLQGINSSDDQTRAATFYGLTPENYQNVLSGDMTRPMGGNQAVYGAQLLSPLEQRAAETARGQGISTMSPETLALAKANPDVFNAASQRFQNYMATTYPGTLEYENVLSGPMQFSDAGVKYPVTKDTVSMYILDPRTNQIIKNPNYKGAKQAADGGLMSLADHMSSKGRGGDSMLVHMTPEEVKSLQALAVKNGTSLTINPDTGLPEAFKLKDLLPMIAGAALGPAGFGLFSTAAGAGLAVGGITTLATGSLSRGLMAGLGAYGGAGLAESLTGAGASAMAAGDIAAQQAAGTFPTLAEGASAEQIAKYASDVGGLRDAALSKAGEASFGAKAAAGFGQMASNPGAYAKDALQYGLAAISPVMADQGVQTATKMPSKATIRRFSYDPYGQTYTSQGSYAAAEEDRKASGGIVALAGGGPSYIDLSRDSSADQIASAYKAFTDASGGNTQQNQAAAIDYLTGLGIGQDRINQAYDKFQAGPTYTNYTTQNILDYTGANKDIDIAAAAKQFNADPRTVAQAINSLGAGYLDSTNTTGGSGAQQYYDAYTNAGINAKELYDAKLLLDPNYSFDAQTGAAGLAAMQRAFDVAKQFDTYKYGTVGNTALEKDIDFLKNYDAGKFTGDRAQQIEDIARETGLSLSEAARRYDAARAGMVTKTTPITCPTGYHYDAATKSCVKNIDVTQNTTTTVTTPTNISTAASTALPVGISGAGVTTINPNGTVTTRPNIPGIPDGGFTGMEQVRNAYTQGGGSLGYVNNAPKSMDEFNERFNRQTGSSLDAYKYLMGKGKDGIAPKYPTNSSTTELMKPYGESALGIIPSRLRPTQRYIYDAAAKRYIRNPDFIPVTYDSTGKRVVGVSDNDILNQLALNDENNPHRVTADKAAGGVIRRYNEGGTAQESVDAAANRLHEFMSKNNVSYERIASLLNISVAEAKRRYPAKAAAPAPGNNKPNYDYSGGNSPGGGTTAPGGFAPDANSVTNGAFNAAMDALGLTQNPNSVPVSDMGTMSLAAISDAIAQANIDAANNTNSIAPDDASGNNDGSATGNDAGVSGVAAPGGGEAPSANPDSATGNDAGVGDAPAGGGEAPSPGDLARGGYIRQRYAAGGISGGLGALARGGAVPQYNLGGYSDGGRLLRGPGDGVSDSIPATIGNRQPARLADGEFVIPARIVSELGNGSTEAGARKLYAMMDRVQKARGKTTGKSRVAANTRSDKYLPA
jgi:hypothetical protein